MKNERDDKQLSPALQALADKTRLTILLMLEVKPRTVGEIVEFFDLSQPTITRHLQQLLKVGLVIRKKQAQKVFYELNSTAIKEFCLESGRLFPLLLHAVDKSARTGFEA